MSYNPDLAPNTDVEIWRRKPDDFYSPSIHVTESGAIGINIGGHVIIAPLEDWFTALFGKMQNAKIDA